LFHHTPKEASASRLPQKLITAKGKKQKNGGSGSEKFKNFRGRQVAGNVLYYRKVYPKNTTTRRRFL
jgi:hypothetical protein